MKQHSVRRLLSLVICIFVLASLFSVCALAENELETVELEIPNPAPEFPTLWVQAVAPDNSVVSNLLLELVLPGSLLLIFPEPQITRVLPFSAVLPTVPTMALLRLLPLSWTADPS